jgi:hypothetical protein
MPCGSACGDSGSTLATEQRKTRCLAALSPDVRAGIVATVKAAGGE